MRSLSLWTSAVTLFLVACGSGDIAREGSAAPSAGGAGGAVGGSASVAGAAGSGLSSAGGAAAGMSAAGASQGGITGASGHAGGVANGGSSGFAGSSGAAGAAGGSGSANAGAAGQSSNAGNGGSDAGASGAAGSMSGGSGQSGAGGGAFATAHHAGLPQLMPHDNMVTPHPEIVTVSYMDFGKTAQAQAFGDALASSPWLAQVGADYGVGTGTHVAKVVLQENAPKTMTDADVFGTLEKHLGVELPAIDANTIYVFYLASTTKVDSNAKMLGVSCPPDGVDGYYGYHDTDTTAAGTLNYAVVMDCTDSVDDMTNTASHEIIEAATDAISGWWYEGSDDDPLGWIDDGTEVADMCEWYPNAEVAGFAFTRVWSNSQAALGASPCIPVPAGEVYRNVSPDKLTMPVVKPGDSATFMLTGWSTAETPDWPIDTYPESTSEGFTPTAVLSSMTINNGKVVMLTLTVPAGAPSQDIGVVNVISDPNGAQFWAVGVQTP